MTNKQIETMILALLASANYDLYKSMVPTLTEEPEEVQSRMPWSQL